MKTKQLWPPFKPRQFSPWKVARILILLFILFPIMVYGWRVLQRPLPTAKTEALFQGIVYYREFRSQPRPHLIHRVEIDLTAPGLAPRVTPGAVGPDDREIAARTTSEFVQEFSLQLGVNANFFFPFQERLPWNSYPQRGDRVNVLGQATAQGKTYSPMEYPWPTLCLGRKSGKLWAKIVTHTEINQGQTCPPNTQEAVSGSHPLVDDGKSLDWSQVLDADSLSARVAIATDAPGETLWIVVVDGKQFLYSEGVTITELTQILQELGVYDAINLDGGGSATLVMARDDRPHLLNAPIHAHLPMEERPVGNHLGFYALPIVTPSSD